MIVLDTDHMTVLERGLGGPSARLRERLSEYAEEEIFTTVVSYSVGRS